MNEQERENIRTRELMNQELTNISGYPNRNRFHSLKMELTAIKQDKKWGTTYEFQNEAKNFFPSILLVREMPENNLQLGDEVEVTIHWVKNND